MKYSSILYLTALHFLLLFSHIPSAHAIVEVVVDGVEKELVDEVTSIITIFQKKDIDDISAIRMRRLFEKSETEITQILQTKGYYRAQLQSELIRQANGWKAIYKITPRDRINIKYINVELARISDDNELFDKHINTFKKNISGVLIHKKYEEAKKILLKNILADGYLDAKMTNHAVDIYLDEYYATVSIQITPGKRYYFGEITILQDKLSEELLRDYVTVKSGDPFTNKSLLKLQNTFRDSDYFEEVDVNPLHNLVNEKNQIPIEIRLTTRRPTKYSLGMGYGTDSGVRGIIAWEKRLVNTNGHKMNAEFKLSQIRNNLTGRYIIPIKNPTTDQFALTTSYVNEFTDSTESHIFHLSGARTLMRKKWQERLSLNYQRESFTVSDQTDIARILFPEISWLRVLADNRTFTNNGLRFNLNIRAASTSAGSDVSFIQVRPQIKIIQSLREKGRLLIRGDVGYTNTSEFSRLPVSLRYFTGGDQSVRGYAYNSLGPEDSSGNVIGGRYLMVGSIEYEQDLIGKWSSAIFIDSGNAMENYGDKLEKGAGIGLRWKSPIGQIRFDVASAITDDEKPWRIHLNIGPDL